MASSLRFLARCLLGGALVGVGFLGAVAVADSFSDVPGSSPFIDDVDWLTDHDIASGFPDGTFRPTEPINRQQASRWLRNYNSGFHIVTATIDPGPSDQFEATVDCPAGERALMGAGGVAGGLDLTLADSYPNETFQWLVRYDAPGNATVDPTQIQAIVLCGPDL